MKSLLDIKTTQFSGTIKFGQWSGQLPIHNKSYLLQNVTFEKIIAALKSGKTVYVGNSYGRKAEKVSHVNSRYHGRCIRTIHIL